MVALLPATVIGSWSFPGWYAKFCDDVARHPELFGPEDREEAVHDAVHLAVGDQLRAGADIISDGEMQRIDFNLGFYDYLEGLKSLPQARLWGPPAHDQRNRYLCVEPLRAPQGLSLVAEYRRLHAITQALLKVPVPGPFTLAGCIQGGAVYRDREAVAAALAPIVNQEMINLVEAGATFLQLDEPSFACHPQQPEKFLDMMARTVSGVRAKISMHMCFGNFRGRAVGWRTYAPLLSHLAKAPVQQLALEFASREMAEVELLKKVPSPMEIAVGLVDVKNTWIEPTELVAERLRTVLRYVEPERIHVTPDCGFSQTARFIAQRKLTALASGVRLGARYSGEKLVSELYLAIKVVMMPRDTNPMGSIFGGVILSYIDQAGAVGARHEVQKAGGTLPNLVTVALNRVEFKKPVQVGDVVCFLTRLVRLGRTSITVHVQVEAERGAEVHQVTEAEVVYVSVDAKDRKPILLLGADA